MQHAAGVLQAIGDERRRRVKHAHDVECHRSGNRAFEIASHPRSDALRHGSEDVSAAIAAAEVESSALITAFPEWLQPARERFEVEGGSGYRRRPEVSPATTKEQLPDAAGGVLRAGRDGVRWNCSLRSGAGGDDEWKADPEPERPQWKSRYARKGTGGCTPD